MRVEAVVSIETIVDTIISSRIKAIVVVIAIVRAVITSIVEAFERNYANFKEKGYCPEAAQALAVESLEKDADQPEESIRFARIYS